MLLFLGHRSLIKNKKQTAVINILSLHIIFIKDLTFSMLFYGYLYLTVMRSLEPIFMLLF